MWWGVSLNGTKCNFVVPENYEGNNVFVENGVRYGKVNNAIWFTNIDNKRRNETLDLYCKYDADAYPKYDNYDAIEVSKVSEIPMDYKGIMGVPITFLGKYNPSQFEILGITNNSIDNAYALKTNTIGYSTWASINGKNVYSRLLIRSRV